MTDQEQKLLPDQNTEWVHVETIDQMQEFYLSKISAIREAAKTCGYAIGLHGSTRRDFDLMAMPWTENYSTKDELASAIQKSACGFTSTKYQWKEKPNGRYAVSFPICWPEWHDMLSAGCIDLSVMPSAQPSPAPDVQNTCPNSCKNIDAKIIVERIAGRLIDGKRNGTYDSALATCVVELKGTCNLFYDFGKADAEIRTVETIKLTPDVQAEAERLYQHFKPGREAEEVRREAERLAKELGFANRLNELLTEGYTPTAVDKIAASLQSMLERGRGEEIQLVDALENLWPPR